VILKRVDGSSSIGIRVCPDLQAMLNSDLPPDIYMVQEFRTGAEYTVNLFFDRSALMCAIPHLRCETRAGEVSKGVTRRLGSLTTIARRLGEALKGDAFGALCFQAIVGETGDVAVFEINARFGGGYPLAHHAGATFTKWLLEMALERPSSAHDNWR